MSVVDATTEGKESAVPPPSHRVPPVEDRRVIRGIVDVIRDGFRWNDAPNAEGPHKPCRIVLGVGVAWACVNALSLSCQTKGPSRRV